MKKGKLTLGLVFCVVPVPVGVLGLENIHKSIFGIFRRSRYRQICWVNSFHCNVDRHTTSTQVDERPLHKVHHDHNDVRMTMAE